MLALILAMAMSLTVSFFCSLLEACALSLSLTDIAKLTEKRPGIAKIWQNFKQNLEKPVAVILILNTLAHTIGASLSGSEFTELFGPRWVVPFSIAFSFAMIEWTELLPKSLGVKHNIRVATLSAIPMRLVIKVISPLLSFLEWVNRPFIGEKHVSVQMNAVDDISVLARFAALNNMLSKDQADILARTMNLSKLLVKDVMVDKEEIKYLKTTMSLMDALIYAHIHHHTRLPLITGDDVDQMIGYVNFKDIVSVLQINPKDPSLKGICRPIISVHEDDSLALILNKLTKSSQHIAVVRTRQEKVVGIVTQEDVMEAIIGEVSDEYDVVPQHCYQITPTRYVAGGGVTLHDLRSYAPINVPDEATSLSDWLKTQCCRIPKIEESFPYEGSRFIIRKISRSNIHEVIIETQPPQNQG
jgi:putative hemolysin